MKFAIRLMLLFWIVVAIVAFARASDEVNASIEVNSGGVNVEPPPRAAPSVNIAPIHSTAPCSQGGAFTLSIPGGGAGLGGGKVNEECMTMEAARIFIQAGAFAFGFALLCSTKSVQATGLAAECPRGRDG